MDPMVSGHGSQTVRWPLRVAAIAALAVACSSGPISTDPNAMTAPQTAAEVEVEIEHAKAVTPLPPGATWRPIELDPHGSYGIYSGASMIEFQAMCAWFAEARAASQVADIERLTKARSIVSEIPTWRSFSDPSQIDDYGRRLIRESVSAVLAGNFGAVAQFMLANCSP
jgi:hypothetical protein